MNDPDKSKLDSVVKKALDKMYDQAVDHCIEIIDNYYLDNPDLWSTGHFSIISEKLQSLKSKPTNENNNS